MAALVLNLASQLLVQIPRTKTLIDANAVCDHLSYDTANATQDGITASTTQTQLGGVVINAAFTNVSTATNNDAVTLPAAVPGRSLTIVNSSGQTIQVFPGVGDKVGANSANAAITEATARSLTLICTLKGVWWGGVTTVS